MRFSFSAELARQRSRRCNSFQSSFSIIIGRPRGQPRRRSASNRFFTHILVAMPVFLKRVVWSKEGSIVY
ncbi:hypothetical protein F9L69_13465 [Brucella melitensis]|uniref:Uncharacterized protein n=2 Tax=Brucella TaxID=234 RepID=A0A7U8K6Z9_BRUNE|nr:hypothetical protein ADS42_013500 [Brucella melitensis]ASU73220.1 hypothetical protein CJP69_13310 [Brucella abortus]EEW81989.1 predicted protein [Brucella abortus NCTC 8038]EEX85599.1 predicted protein [Brucella ceti B1/94]EEY02701.1 predicted protein [Brucella neotomae 5K33]EEY24663.1 predicted protein [Brucella sp. F5/99]EEZ13203.1 predicted protein [Brucella melitensis bv. 1 str. Rev.1]EEZ16575.1 predicted protein [Brucella melitensis bv. 2 str. 63/9]